MRSILSLDVESEVEMSVEVEGGATLGDVVKYLAPRGLALKNIPSLPHVTIAGALATATHGSGLQHGAEAGMPSMCREVEFVTHQGDAVAYRRGADAQFQAAVVHLGALGVVSRAVLDVVPSFEVEQRVYEGVDLDQFFPEFEAVARSVDSLTVGINFGANDGKGAGLLWYRYYDRADGLGTPTPPAAASCFGGDLRNNDVPFYESQVGVAATRRGPWYDVPSFFMEDMREINMPKLAMQSEYFVPLEFASAALQAVREVASRWPGWPISEAWEDLNERVPVFHCEVRAIPADGLGGLCPFADRDSCSIHFTWGDASHRGRVVEMIRELEAVLRPFGARPHWGKFNLYSHQDLRAAYRENAFDEFHALYHAHDADGKFVNELVHKQVWGRGREITYIGSPDG